MDEAYSSLPSSHLLGSVPVVITEYKRPETRDGTHENLQNFPPGNGGYLAPGSPYNGGDEQAATSWKGVFDISSYSAYFNVDTDMVIDRVICSVYPIHGDFFRKIDDNPDLYGPVWISTTLVFMLAALGNCASYLMQRRIDPNSMWNFDVNYVKWAAYLIYGYILILPAAFYFLLQYFGLNASLLHLWCIWGYSLCIFIPTSLILVVPVEIFQWVIILIAGSTSACFISLNVKSITEGGDVMFSMASAFVLQLVLALLIKILFFE